MKYEPPFWLFYILVAVAIGLAVYLTIRDLRRKGKQQSKDITPEIRETLLQLHSAHSNLAEQIACSITKEQVKDAYMNLITLYQSKGKMQSISASEADKDTREMLEMAFKSLKLKSANDANGLLFISNMAWSMKAQSIKLESAKEKTEYLAVTKKLDSLRVKAPKLDKQIGGCIKYSYKLNIWYALALWIQKHKDKLPLDLQIEVIKNKELMDDFIHELISKVGK